MSMDRYYSVDAVHAAHDQMCKEFNILGEEIENLKAKIEKLKQEKAELIEILERHVLRKT